MSQKLLLNGEDFFGIVISNAEEQKKLADICKRYGIKFVSSDLETEKTLHHLWGLSNKTIGLVGTVIMSTLPQERIIRGVEEFENVLKKAL